MSTDESGTRRRTFKREESAILSILKEWDPIPGSPKDEYECLAHHLLGALHRNRSVNDIRLLIEGEMDGHFGIRVSADEVRQVAERIASWWDTGAREEYTSNTPVQSDRATRG